MTTFIPVEYKKGELWMNVDFVRFIFKVKGAYHLQTEDGKGFSVAASGYDAVEALIAARQVSQ
ncbi:hypothetical protein ACI79C_03345 [Geodermatophilus sp. SYSU D00697]